MKELSMDSEIDEFESPWTHLPLGVQNLHHFMHNKAIFSTEDSSQK